MSANGNAPFYVDFLDNEHYFRGREEILLRLHETLQANNAAAITGVTGMGGVGKTQLAVRYVYQYRAHYPDGIYLLPAAADLRKVFADFGQKLWMIAAYRNQEIEKQPLATLARLIRTLFDDEELIILCFDLNIPEGDLPDRPEARPLALVEYARRQGRLADLVRKLEVDRPFLQTLPQDELISLVFNYFQQNPRSLLVLDNLPNPARLVEPVSQNHYLADLPCGVLFTTRSQNTGEFPALPLDCLPLPEAMDILLADPVRRVVLNPQHPDHSEAQTICRLVGQLPLALRNAGAYLGEYEEVALAAYRQRLQTEGCLITLDEDLAELQEDELVERQRAAVAATLTTQWEALKQENAKKLMQVAGLLPEAEYIPVDRLALLAGISTMNKPGRPLPVMRCLKQLQRVSLIEEMREDHLRLHPLVREFAASQNTTDTEALRRACGENLADAYEYFPVLEAQCQRRGIYEVQKDLLVALELLGLDQRQLGSTPTPRLQTLLRLLRQESHSLKEWESQKNDAFIAQQMVYRLLNEDVDPLLITAAARLEQSQTTYFKPEWAAQKRSTMLIHTLVSHSGWVTAVAVTPNGQRAISASSDSTLKVWHLHTGQEEHTLVGHSSSVSAVVMTPDGQRAISASYDHTLKVWNLHTGQEEHTLAGHFSQVMAVAVTPDGQLAISASEDHTLKVWHLHTGQEEHTLAGHSAWVNAVAVTPDGQRAISASEDHTLKVWNVNSGQEEHTLTGHFSRVNAVAVTPDGQHAISASDDHTLKVWNVNSGREMASITLDGQLYCLVLGEDGMTLVCGDGAGNVYCLRVVVPR